MVSKKNKDDLDTLFGASPPREIKLSYSRISDFYKNGPIALIRRTSLEGEGVKMGNLTDDLLYSKMVDKTHFNKLYYVYDGGKPTATLAKLANIILKTEVEKPTTKRILEIIKKNSFWSATVDPEKLIKKFNNPQFWNYVNAHYDSKNKVIVSTNEYSLAEELVNVILTHEYSKFIFKDEKNRKTLYQHPFKFEYKGFILRGILDFIIIDYRLKTVQFIDLKTGRDEAENFLISFLKYRYDLQEAAYTDAFEQICKDLGLEGFRLLPFQFLYISRYEKVPYIYEVPEKWHVAAKNGYYSGKRYVKGFYELIDDIAWHWDNKIFDTSRLLHDNKGKLILDESFIDLKK